jgi:hypothetical protein
MMSVEDASVYYKRYDDNEIEPSNDSQNFIDPSIAECYLSFSKILQSELRKFDKRESSIL